jgi:hypothetical protein
MGQVFLVLGFPRQKYITNTPYSNLRVKHLPPTLHNVTKWQRRQPEHQRLSLYISFIT